MLKNLHGINLLLIFEVLNNQSEIMGTTIKETINLAGRISGILAKQTGKMVGTHGVEEGSFELSLGGEPHAGGSYYIDNNHLILASVTPQKDLGEITDLKTIENNLREL
jgi:hypothetical protein